MKLWLNNIYYSFPIQLFILHFRKYQMLLFFWYLLYSIIDSGLLHSYGADALFFVPEYLGTTNALAGAYVGIALGVFFMSWNITTFILHSKRFKFLATAPKPFLKYCTNNALMPLVFLIFYMIKWIHFDVHSELMNNKDVFFLIGGFIIGLVFQVVFSFIFFFSADRSILHVLTPIIASPQSYKETFHPNRQNHGDPLAMKVSYYFSIRGKLRKPRDVSHYSEEFLDTIFKRHHFAGMMGIILAFVFLITVGFFLDIKVFQFPAASSIIVFCAAMVAVIGSFTYFLQSWSLPFLIVLVGIFNFLYTKEIIDPRNKAYGLNYDNKNERPVYDRKKVESLCTPSIIAADKANMLQVLNNWKQKQHCNKPVMIFLNVSGGGLRSATFSMNMMQKLDSITQGRLMQQTFMISGSSGGMLAAAYYRELYCRKLNGEAIDLANPTYTNNITQDLLNPIFTSMIDRDIFAPVQKFTVEPYQYIKDRGYAFEEKLNDNLQGVLGKQLKDYKKDETKARVPMIIFNSVITRDGRKLVMGTQPMSFMMKPALYANDETVSPDAVDFSGLLSKQNPLNIRILTALRMNATFPYVLPNVWLPTHPIVDVMDAGLRDNYGAETTLRFIDNFKDWIKQNTSGVVIIQLRDRSKDNWQHPLLIGSVTDALVKPATMLQHNWYKLEDYFLRDQYNYSYDSTMNMHCLKFMYAPEDLEQGATLNFHLTVIEKKEVIRSGNSSYNQALIKQLQQILR